jgi:hypothetical protein
LANHGGDFTIFEKKNKFAKKQIFSNEKVDDQPAQDEPEKALMYYLTG